VTTQWNPLLASSPVEAGEALETLSTLCRQYWYPLYAFTRRMGSEPDEAQELVQGFLGHLLERKQFHLVDRWRGRLRPWLLTSFKHYLTYTWEREPPLKPRRGRVVLSQVIRSRDMREAERLYGEEPVEELSPEWLYQYTWAMAVQRHTWAALRKEYEFSSSKMLMTRLEELMPSGTDLGAFRRLADEVGMSVGAVRAVVQKMRDRYRELLRATVAHTLLHPEDVDAELRELLAAL
jgi:DNA-directed RNA polymerase specialized sigma24 family protein